MNPEAEALIKEILAHIKLKTVVSKDNVVFINNYFQSSQYIKWCCRNCINHEDFVNIVKLVNYINNGVLLMRWKTGKPHIVVGSKLIFVETYISEQKIKTRSDKQSV